MLVGPFIFQGLMVVTQIQRILSPLFITRSTTYSVFHQVFWGLRSHGSHGPGVWYCVGTQVACELWKDQPGDQHWTDQWPTTNGGKPRWKAMMQRPAERWRPLGIGQIISGIPCFINHMFFLLENSITKQQNIGNIMTCGILPCRNVGMFADRYIYIFMYTLYMYI